MDTIGIVKKNFHLSTTFILYGYLAAQKYKVKRSSFFQMLSESLKREDTTMLMKLRVALKFKKNGLPHIKIGGNGYNFYDCQCTGKSMHDIQTHTHTNPLFPSKFMTKNKNTLICTSILKTIFP